MKEFSQRKVLPYSQEFLFNMVSDIEEYPKFIPGCQRIDVIDKKNNNMIADLYAGAGGITKKYRSHISLTPYEIVEIKQIGGDLFQFLESYWKFFPINDKETEVEFFIKFQMNSSLMQMMLERVFMETTKKVMDSFTQRAAEISGKLMS